MQEEGATLSNSVTIEEKETLQTDYLEKVYGHDRKYAADMFGLFLETVPKQFALLKPLIEEQKVDEISKLAHQLKPSFTMVGLPEITQNLLMLEKMAKNKEDYETLRLTFDEIENIFNRKISLVEKEFDELQ